MNRVTRKVLMMLLASAALAAGAFLAQKYTSGSDGNSGYPYTADVWLLDTFCTLTVYSGGGEQALALGVDQLGYYDALFDAEQETSDLYRINHRGEAAEVKISRETAEMLEGARQISCFTDGTLCPAIRPLTELWDFKNAVSVPEAEDIQNALDASHAGVWKIIQKEDGSWYFTAEDSRTAIEAGAFAKGYIADRIRETLLKAGVTSAVIDLGGNVHTAGGKPDGTPFRIGIRDPKGEKDSLKILEAEDESVVTAGNYERYFEADGERWHHILDPETGYPVRNGLSSVTVRGPSSFVCDALATACFVCGTEKGMRLIEDWNRENGTCYTAWFLDENGVFTSTEENS